MNNSYIELRDENGTYRVTRDVADVSLDNIFEDLIVPVLLAAGYRLESIEKYLA